MRMKHKVKNTFFLLLLAFSYLFSVFLPITAEENTSNGDHQEIRITSDDSGLTVKGIPEESSEKYKTKISSQYSDTYSIGEIFTAVNITYSDETGKPVQPLKAVDITITDLSIPEGTKAAVFHIENDDVIIISSVNDTTSVSFTTEKTGVFLVAEVFTKHQVITAFEPWKDGEFGNDTEGRKCRFTVEYDDPTAAGIVRALPDYVYGYTEENSQIQKLPVSAWTHNYTDGETGIFVFTPEVDKNSYTVKEGVEQLVLEVAVNHPYSFSSTKAHASRKRISLKAAGSTSSARSDILGGSYKQTSALSDADKEDDYQKNYQEAVGSDENNYLLKSAEWEDIDEGKALITVTGQRNDIPRVVYAFITCQSHGFNKSICIRNIQQLVSKYPIVDVIAIDGPDEWGANAAAGGRVCGIEPVKTFTPDNASEISNWVNDSVYWRYGNHYTMNIPAALRKYLFGSINGTISEANMIRHPNAIFVSFDFLYDNANYGDGSGHKANQPYEGNINDAYDSSGMLWKYATADFFSFITRNYITGGKRYFSMSDVAKGSSGTMSIYGAMDEKESSDDQRMKIIEGVANPDKFGQMPCGAWDMDAYTTNVKLTGTPSDYDYSNDFSSANVPMPEGTVKLTDTVSDRYSITSVETTAGNSAVTVKSTVNGNTVTASSSNYQPGTEITMKIHAQVKDTETYFEEFEDTNTENAALTAATTTVASVASPKLSRFKPKLTVQYLEKGTEKVLAAEYSRRYKPGETYTVPSPDVTGYMLDDNAQKTVTGTMPKRNHLIKVYYVKPTPPTKTVTNDAGKDIHQKYVNDGDTLHYAITLINPASTEKEYTITDQIPGNVTVKNIENGGKLEGNTITWTVKVNGGTSATVKWNATANGKGVTITNSAKETIEGITLESNTVKNWTPEEPVKHVLNESGKDIHKTMRVSGQELTYTITFSNPADIAKTATVMDELPKGLQFISASDGGSYRNGTITWSVPMNAKSGKTLTVKAKILEGAKGFVLKNKAVLKYDDINVTTNEVINPVMPDPVKTVQDSEGRDIDLKYVLDGDELHYAITFENPAEEAKSFTITDEIPKNVEFLSIEDSGVRNGNTLTWKVDVEGGTSATVHWAAAAKGKGITIRNTASVTVEEISLETNTVENWTPEDPIKHVLDESRKDIDRDMRISGQELTYTITIHNPASVWKQATVTDVLPDGTEFLSQDDGQPEVLLRAAELKEPGFSQDGQILTWVIDMIPEEERTITVTVKILDSAKDSILKNKALLHYDYIELVTNEVENPVLPDPIKEVQDDEGNDIHQFLVNENDQLHYFITFKNPADETKMFTITDIMPDHTVFVSADHDGQLTASDTVEGAATVVWQMEMEPHAEETVGFIVKTVGTHTYIPNTGNAAVDEVNLDTNTVENWVPEDPVKKVQNEKGEDANYGILFAQDNRRLTYFLEVNNNSSLEKEYTVTDELDEKLVFLSADHDGIYDEQKHMITWTITVSPDTTETLSFIAEPDNVSTGKKIVNDIEAESDNYNNRSNIVVNYLDDSPEKITIEGRKIWEMNNIDVELSDSIMIRLMANGEEIRSERITSDTDHNWSFSFTNVPKYMFGKEVEYTVSEDPVEGYQTVIEGNYQEGFTVINSKDPLPEKHVLNSVGTDINGRIVRIGEEITYMVTYTNPFETEKEYTITDKLPKGVKFLSADNDGTYKNGVVSWMISTPAGEERTVHVQVKVTEDAFETLYNRALVGVDDQKIITNEVENPVLPDPVKDVLNSDGISINHQEVRIGDELTYTVTFQNPYDSEADMTVTDELPEGLEYLSSSDDGIWSDGSVTWNIRMNANEERTVSAIVKVSDTASEVLVNEAAVTVDDVTVITNEVYNPVIKDPVKQVLDPKGTDIDGKAVHPKDQLVYTITYENPYDRDIQSTVTDRIPEGLKFISADHNGKEVNHLITWNVELKAYEKMTVSFTAEVLKTDYESFINSADVTIGSLKLKTNEVKNPLEYTPEIKPVKDVLNETKQSINGKEVKPDDLITYTITFENPYDIEHTFTVTDVLPEEVEYISADQGASELSYNKTTKVVWEVSVPAKQKHIVSVVARVKNPEKEVTFKNTGSVFLNDTEFKTNEVKNSAKHCDECCVAEPTGTPATATPESGKPADNNPSSPTAAPSASAQPKYIRNLPNTGDTSSLMKYGTSFSLALLGIGYAVYRLRKGSR